MGKHGTRVATVVLAGGQGTRLYPLTLHHCKPATAFGGRYRLIDVPISNAINSGLREIFVIAQYLSSELNHHIHQTYRFETYRSGFIDVLTPQVCEEEKKEWFLGTADAVRKNLKTLLKSDADLFLILSGDQLYHIDFQDMIETALKKRADLLIASIAVGKQDAKRMGLLRIDKRRKITDFVEKPKGEKKLQSLILKKGFCEKNGIDFSPKTPYLGSMGIYIFKRKVLIDLLREDQREDFGYHLLQSAVKRKKAYTYIYPGYWEDIGTVGSYYKANLLLTDPDCPLKIYDESNPIYTRPSFLPGPKIRNATIVKSIICEGSLIEAKEIHHSIIGIRSHIKKGTIIRKSVVMGNHFYMPPLKDEGPGKLGSIGEGCRIEKAIIDEHAEIGNRVQLINKKGYKHFDSKHLFVRDGIIIVTSGAKLPNNFVF